MGRTRQPNERLGQLIRESGRPNEALARALCAVAASRGDPARPSRSSVTQWVRYGWNPSGSLPQYLAEVLTRWLDRDVSLAEMGLGEEEPDLRDWSLDTLKALAALGRIDVDVERRQLLRTLPYSLGALSIPPSSWWEHMARTGSRNITQHRAGRADVEAVREMTGLFSQLDQRRGGGHGRTAVAQYLLTDVRDFLRGTFASDQARRDMFSAASELAYLAGWTAFDNGEHPTAQHYYTVAVKLAAEADDPAMAGHVLRAMAHQAVDLGKPEHAVRVAEASMAGARYTRASPRERSLLGVVHARGLAAAGRAPEANAALLQAERDLSAASPDDDEPARVFFFGEASLAHETASALRDIGDLDGAAREFERSVATRKVSSFTRTHAVTLGHLGLVKAEQHSVEEACTIWAQSLDAMQTVRSARTRDVALQIRGALSAYRGRKVPVISTIDRRAAEYLAATA
ncbi:Tat pathway signal protein [Kitasatospora sp. NPDC094011]|uniref:Tat pathway signal protein n=1 Tax=Kitasatospora sp. NPDC094011 TaxID=3364090 RepID=UPI00382A8DC5